MLSCPAIKPKVAFGLFALPASVLSICAIEGVGFVAENPVARRNVKAQGLYMLGEREFLDFVELSIKTQSPYSIYAHEVTRNQERRNDQGPSPSVPASPTTTPWSTKAQILMGLHSEIPLDDPANRVNWRRDRRMGMYHNVKALDTLSEQQPSALRQFLRQLAASERAGRGKAHAGRPGHGRVPRVRDRPQGPGLHAQARR